MFVHAELYSRLRVRSARRNLWRAPLVVFLFATVVATFSVVWSANANASAKMACHSKAADRARKCRSHQSRRARRCGVARRSSHSRRRARHCNIGARPSAAHNVAKRTKTPGTPTTTTDTTPPSAPSNLTATAGNEQVSLSWGASTDNVGISGYSVYRDGAQVAQTTTTSFTDTALTDGSSYSYYVVAHDAAGNDSTASNTVSATPVAPTSPTSSSSSSIYWGAWIKNSFGEAPWSMTAAATFEQSVGKAVSIINWSSPFVSSTYCGGYCGFQTAEYEAVRNHGAIPFFSWNPGPGTGNFTDAQIAAGAQDSYLRAWASAAKSWGHPLFLRFAWEMNGSWFPWGVGNNGTRASDYVAMWRHVHDVFASEGATNVTWVWCPNIDPYNTLAPLSSLYPGDSYVDWTCLDGYNGDDPWASFGSLFTSSYNAITDTIAPSKPMIIGETASTETGGSKAQWITDLLGGLPAGFPKIRGLLWFDKVGLGPGGYSDWPIESSLTATLAFLDGIQNSAYTTNTYATLNTSPIPPPS